MKPVEAKNLPIEYKMDKEMMSLLAEANEKYGQYKSLIKLFKFDSKFFLNSLILNESLTSSKIEGTQISQSDIYYLDYKAENDDILEIKNLKKMIEEIKTGLGKENKIDIFLLNKMHNILLNSVRGSNKNPGHIRSTQNYIGPKGCSIDEATFIPPIPEKVPILLNNLFEYMNDLYIDPLFINIAISHSQFETIHPYNDGNGRLGRALIPIQLGILKEEEPILFLSEIIEVYRPTYYRLLNESRNGNMERFIKFFLQCITEQCNSYIYKIEKINSIYEEDYKYVSENISGVAIFKLMPLLIKNIVFSVDKISAQVEIHKNTLLRLLDKLVQLSILDKEKVKDTNRITYKYKRVYEIFVKNE